MFLQNYLTWPEVTGWTIAGIFFFIVLYYVTFVLIREKVKDDARDEARWHIMMNFLTRHNLVTPEIMLIKKYFSPLPEAEKITILDSRSRFHDKLLEYLKQQEDVEPETIVTIVDKLFPRQGYQMEIETIHDLYLGEMCALESVNTHYLGTVMKKTEDDILLRIEDFKPQDHLPEEEVSIYVFRPIAGGYLISGTLRQISEDAVIFHFSGQIKEKGEHHLMSEIKVPVTFVPWPLDEKKSKTNRINGTSIKISDRAVLFFSKYKDETEYLARRNDLWMGAFKTPGGFKFSCRGMIRKSKMEPDKFIFQFLDAPEVSRKVLFVEIRENKPVREKLY